MCLLQQISTLSKNNIDDMTNYEFDPSCIDCKWNNAVIFYRTQNY